MLLEDSVLLGDSVLLEGVVLNARVLLEDTVLIAKVVIQEGRVNGNILEGGCRLRVGVRVMELRVREVGCALEKVYEGGMHVRRKLIEVGHLAGVVEKASANRSLLWMVWTLMSTSRRRRVCDAFYTSLRLSKSEVHASVEVG